jgi:hypothetical protein
LTLYQSSMLNRVAQYVALLLLVGCGGSTAPSAGPNLVASKVAVVAIAIATGGEGHGFFDNVITCPRRGVINYINTALGRSATITGCDAGDGVVIDGNAEVRWVTGTDRSRIARVDVVGSLRVRGPDGNETTVTELSATGISFTSPNEPSVLNVVIAPIRVTASGETAPLDARASPVNVFAPSGRGIDAIPNPSGSLDVLTEADLKSIAYGTAMRLASLLFEETIDSRGDHVHSLPCGTIRVTPDAATTLVRLENSWTACDLGGGVIVSGTFTQRWTAFQSGSNRMAMVIEGQMMLGGNTPRTALTRLEWSMTALSAPGNLRISGTLVGSSGERAFSFDLVADD